VRRLSRAGYVNCPGEAASPSGAAHQQPLSMRDSRGSASAAALGQQIDAGFKAAGETSSLSNQAGAWPERCFSTPGLLGLARQSPMLLAKSSPTIEPRGSCRHLKIGNQQVGHQDSTQPTPAPRAIWPARRGLLSPAPHPGGEFPTAERGVSSRNQRQGNKRAGRPHHRGCPL